MRCQCGVELAEIAHQLSANGDHDAKLHDTSARRRTAHLDDRQPAALAEPRQ
jgi:hypothetical protein